MRLRSQSLRVSPLLTPPPVRRSRSEDHRDALVVLARVEPGGKAASARLKKVLDVKDSAQYGFIDVKGGGVKSALRSAQHLITFAEKVLQR